MTMADNIQVEPSGHAKAVDVATVELNGVHIPQYMLVDDEGTNVVEPYSGALRTIETEHALIHSGKGFQLSGTIDALAAGASAYFLIDPVTPIHWRQYKFHYVCPEILSAISV